MPELQEISLANRITKRLHAKILAEQKLLERETGVKASVNQVVRMLIEAGIEARAKQRSGR